MSAAEVTAGSTTNTMKESLQKITWTQNGVKQCVKLLPGGLFGRMCDELLEEIQRTNGKPGERVMLIRSGDMEKIRAYPYEPGKDLTKTPIREEEVLLQNEGAEVPVTVYRPEEAKDGRPAVLYMHGGAWMYGDRKTVRNLCRYLSEMADAVIFSVEYRLAPEHPFPEGMTDCEAALRYVAAHASSYGADPSNITVSGDSAGGNIAAVLSHRDRKQGTSFIRKQVLLYPAVAVNEAEQDPACTFSLSQYIYEDAQKPMIEPRILSLYMAGKDAEKAYLQGRTSLTDPDAAPLFDDNFAGLPETLLISAQYDYLTQQGKAYAEKLAKDGTSVTMITYAGVFHGFAENIGDYPQCADAIEEAAAFIQGTSSL